jgi:hypothetical protein
MRPVALGRKNWIHIGSPQAGPKVAAILGRGKLPALEDFHTCLSGCEHGAASQCHR